MLSYSKGPRKSANEGKGVALRGLYFGRPPARPAQPAQVAAQPAAQPVEPEQPEQAQIVEQPSPPNAEAA
jgi:hypothetical protein